jgi:hypothetical protein
VDCMALPPSPWNDISQSPPARPLGVAVAASVRDKASTSVLSAVRTKTRLASTRRTMLLRLQVYEVDTSNVHRWCIAYFWQSRRTAEVLGLERVSMSCAMALRCDDLGAEDADRLICTPLIPPEGAPAMRSPSCQAPVQLNRGLVVVLLPIELDYGIGTLYKWIENRNRQDSVISSRSLT